MVRGGQTMTRKEVKNLLPILQAFTEGRVIQYRDNGVWKDITTEDGFYAEYAFVNVNDYRIKPELTYRPFANAEECWNEMLKHQPVGWLKHKVSKARYSIGSFDIENVYVGTAQTKYAYNKALDEFIFADGAPFGVKEESDD